MIYYRIGNLLEQPDINVLIHCCNIYCTMQAGVALSIKNKYPEAYQADKKTKYGDKSKIGTFSWARTSDDKIICNLYTMKGLGTKERQLDYEAFYSCLEQIRDLINNSTKSYKIGIPYKIGSDLAGGDFEVVKSMINSVFGGYDIPVIICVLPKFEREINWINVNYETE